MGERHIDNGLEAAPAPVDETLSQSIGVPPANSAHPVQTVRTLSPEVLLDVAEEVRGSFTRALGKPQLVLIEVDPYRLHAFWTVTREAMELAQSELGNHTKNVSLILRVLEDETNGIETAEEMAFDVEVGGLQSRSYVDIFGEARRYRAVLGLRAADDRFAALAASNTVELPPRSSAASNGLLQINMESLEAGPFSQQPAPPHQGAPAPFPLALEGSDGREALGVADPNERAVQPPATESPLGDGSAASRPPLVLEEAIASSSYGLGRAGGFEVTAELYVFGHADPDQELRLFGRTIPMRPDGSFSIRRLLPNDPSVIEALLNSGDGSTERGEG